jgi:S-disulfanyl-L-cysteine oxidoreductase SoxD
LTRMKLTIAVALTCVAMAIGLSGSPKRILAQTSRTQWDGVFTAAQARRGEELYRVVCGYCHGLDLEGGAGGADVGPGLKGTDFVAAWNKKSLGDLFGLILQSMPQDRPGSVTPQEAADLVAFLMLENDAPAGATELPPQPDVLKTIAFSARKP